MKETKVDTPSPPSTADKFGEFDTSEKPAQKASDSSKPLTPAQTRKPKTSRRQKRAQGRRRRQRKAPQHNDPLPDGSVPLNHSPEVLLRELLEANKEPPTLQGPVANRAVERINGPSPTPLKFSPLLSLAQESADEDLAKPLMELPVSKALEI